MKRAIYLSIISVFAVNIVNAQQGFGTSNPDKSAVIDMKVSNKGALLPRVAL